MNLVVSRPGRRPGAERPVVIASLAVLAALCWAGLLVYNSAIGAPGPPMPDGIAGLPRPASPSYHAADFVLAFGIWASVAWAMMLPGATPAVLQFARANLLYRAVRRPYRATALFVAGYLAAWSLFAALATLSQWALHGATAPAGGMLDAVLAAGGSTVAGLLLVAAGVYQWTPGKHACLQHCRAPLDSMLVGWQGGAWGALRMGALHGLHCIGCCGLLAALLCAAGVLNLPAVAALALLVLAEKLAPGGPALACIAGLVLVGGGTLLLFP